MRREGTFVKENWTTEGRKAIEEIDISPASCLKCQKADVCILYRSEIQMLQNYYGHIEDKSEWPCEPEDRAVKCKKYLPMNWQEIAR